MIDQFHVDTGRYPESLEQLVEKKYLPALPFDPVADSDGAWILVAPEEAGMGAVADLHSAAAGKGRNGKPYAEW